MPEAAWKIKRMEAACGPYTHYLLNRVYGFNAAITKKITVGLDIYDLLCPYAPVLDWQALLHLSGNDPHGVTLGKKDWGVLKNKFLTIQNYFQD